MGSQRIKDAGVEVIAPHAPLTGVPGWVLYCAAEDQGQQYNALFEAGKAVGAGPVASRALMGLRVVKGYGARGRDDRREY